MNRISKENYYLDIAETVLERATCLRRIYGAIIVKNDEIISTGYNGAPRGHGREHIDHQLHHRIHQRHAGDRRLARRRDHDGIRHAHSDCQCLFK